MNLRTRRREELSINLTPLIDVVFLLLIFFMVSTTFTKEGSFKVDLPEASSGQEETETKQVVVSIDRSGRYFINDQALNDSELETLKGALQKLKASLKKDQPIVIKADAEAAHQAVVKVLDAAGQLGLTRISIANNLSLSE